MKRGSHRNLTIALLLAAIALYAFNAIAADEPAKAPATQPAKATTQPAKAAPVVPAAAAAAGPTHECWLDKIKQPAPWIKMGGDQRNRELWSTNMVSLDNKTPGHEQHWQTYRTRLWTTVTPIKDVDINARIIWEFVNWCEPVSKGRDTDLNEALFDTLNVKWKNTFDLPNTLTVGRQDLLDFGRGWLLFEGTPLDGSRTIFFDAVRDTIEFKDIQTTADLIYIHQEAFEEDAITPFNSRKRYIDEQDTNGAVVWLKNKSIERTQVDGYFIYKRNDKVLANGENADIYTFGQRLDHNFNDHWNFWTDLAEQFGNKNGTSYGALGSTSRLTYFFRDAWNSEARAGFEFLSGSEDVNKNFDPLWGRWPQWSDLIVYTYASETRIAQVTNLQRLNLGYTTRPCKPIELSFDYNLLFAVDDYENRPGFSNSSLFRGQLLSAILRYKFTPHITGHLQGEVLFPGDFYDGRNDVAVFARYDLTFVW